jgi:DNA-binding transcriptional ArsR family regulator
MRVTDALETDSRPSLSPSPSPPPEALDLVAVLHALADPIRLDMVRRLDAAPGELSCHELDVPVGKSTSSHHLKVLREAGVVTARDAGTRRYYLVRRADLETRFPGLLDAVLHAG